MTTYYYHFDGLGSVAALSNNSGEIVERYEYDVFGRPDRVSDVNNPYFFTGRRYDDETGLYYYRARYYDPYIGRFLQTDPVGYAYGLNLYTYCGNNPVNWIDPWGLYPWSNKGFTATVGSSAAGGAAAGAITGAIAGAHAGGVGALPGAWGGAKLGAGLGAVAGAAGYIAGWGITNAWDALFGDEDEGETETTGKKGSQT